MQNMGQKTLFLLAIYILILSPYTIAKEVTIQLLWKHQFQFAGYYMAKEKGYYKDVNLDVNIKEYQNGIDIVDDVINGKVEFGVGRSSLIHDRLEGKPVVMLASIFQHSPVVLVTKKRDDIKKVSDFKNKNIMLTDNQINLASINAMLISSGVSKDMYTTKAHTFNVDDLIDNKTDVVFSYISNEPFQLKQKNIEYTVFSPKDYGFDFYSDILFTSEEFIHENEELVKAFKKASLKGWQYAMENQDETVKLILEKYNTQNKTKEALKFEAQTMFDLIDTKYIPLGNINSAKVNSIAQVYKLMGFVKKNLSIKNIIYDDLHRHDVEKNDFDIDGFFAKFIPVVTNPLYNLELEDLPSQTNFLLSENTNVQAVVIKDSLDDQNVLTFYRNSDNLIFNEDIPLSYLKHEKASRTIIYDDEEIGKVSVYYNDDDTSTIKLTQEEKEWIKTHTPNIGVEQFAPVVFSNNGSDIDGIVGDYLKIITEKTGLKFNVTTGDWNILLSDFKNKKIDLLPDAYYSGERTTYGLFSKSYFKVKDYIYLKEENRDIKSLKDLKNKTLAIEKGYATIEKIQAKYPDIKLVLTNNLDESINKVLTGEVDALYQGQVVVERKISDELIVGLKGIPSSSFTSPTLHFFSKLEEPLLQSILQKGLDSITFTKKKEIQEKWLNSKDKTLNIQNFKDISLAGIMSYEELIGALFIFLVIGYIVYKQYSKTNILNIRLKTFNIVIIIFELAVILFMVYAIIILDRTENTLAIEHSEQSKMIQTANILRQSSDYLTHFARTYAVTGNEIYEQQYLDTLEIRNGEKARPEGYDGIYWDLDEESRLERHPDVEKKAFKDIIKESHFSKEEIAKLQEAEDNSNDLVNIETEAFTAIKNNNKNYAIELLHSRDYYVAKQKIMLPIDELISMIYTRTGSNISVLNSQIQNQFKYILVVGFLFILGNILIYILLRKKVNQPIEYLTGVIRRFQDGEKDIEEKSFYNDEIGEMKTKFFVMQNQLIKAKEKAIILGNAKSEFLANMSHEIRTPLNAILGFIDLLKEEAENKTSVEYLNIIDSSSKSLLNIIEDILDFSKIECGKLEIDKIDFDTRAEFEVITYLFDAKCSEKDIILTLNIDENVPKYINSDPYRLKQIISNLLSNAVKFTDNGKRIIVSISYQDTFLHVAVKDEGKGIAKEKQEQIFSAFGQEDSSTTREYGGTGLGLSISMQLSKLLGGELKLKSEVGVGSEFYFSVPVEIGQDVEVKTTIDAEITLSGNLLLVEDNKTNQLFMKIIFNKIGLEYDVANDGLEAIKLFKENKYDVILMDENMPNMSGIEATKQILKLEKENNLIHTPIIALTANALKGDREKFLDAGMDEYMTKPLERQILIQKLSILLND